MNCTCFCSKTLTRWLWFACFYKVKLFILQPEIYDHQAGSSNQIKSKPTIEHVCVIPDSSACWAAAGERQQLIAWRFSRGEWFLSVDPCWLGAPLHLEGLHRRCTDQSRKISAFWWSLLHHGFCVHALFSFVFVFSHRVLHECGNSTMMSAAGRHWMKKPKKRKAFKWLWWRKLCNVCFFCLFAWLRR